MSMIVLGDEKHSLFCYASASSSPQWQANIIIQIQSF
jgi:hypothetical protein